MGLADVLPADAIVEPKGRYLADLMGRGVQGTADAVVLPSTADEVAAVMRWCYENDVPLTARGGGTGLAGGAIDTSVWPGIPPGDQPQGLATVRG